ncbi:MAG: hypothetical protein N2Z70_03810 [Bdellovibrionaceae bacterium]|jgi:hypothetical protein|nr:hypothetical protein [Pseudobdellovibrionaceae bacterium]
MSGLLILLLLVLVSLFLWRERDETWRKFSHFWTGSGSHPKEAAALSLSSQRKVQTLDPVTQKYIRTFEVVSKSQSLQVYFNFNGHTFEAYELLQLPAGASWEQVQNRWSSMTSQEHNELVKRAYEVLREKLRS